MFVSFPIVFFAGLGWFALGEADPALVFLLSSPPSRAPGLCERGFVIQNTLPEALIPHFSAEESSASHSIPDLCTSPRGNAAPAVCMLPSAAPVFRDSLQIWGLTVSGGLLTAPPL